MVKIGPPGPKVNTLDIDPTHAYADTSSETLQIMNFFEKLRPVEIEDLEPDDRRCPICSEEYTRNSHRAKIHSKEKPDPPAPILAPAVGKLWDYAYAQAGIALSERERRAREDLLRYIDDYRARGLDEYYPSDEAMAGYERSTSVRLIAFVLSLDFITLTPRQERLLRRLRDIAEDLDPVYAMWRRNDLGTLFFEYEGGWETEEHESDEEVEAEEEIIEGDTEEMRFFRALFR
ncbi:hypothetical protein MMC29_007317 [Sticta canariensis]|nr:hypothetical protein [Sticta canariensis]